MSVRPDVIVIPESKGTAKDFLKQQIIFLNI